MVWQVFKNDYEKLTCEFVARSRKIVQEAENASQQVSDGKVADYFKFVASGIAATAEAVEKSEVPTFEEYQRRMYELPTVIVKLDGKFEDL